MNHLRGNWLLFRIIAIYAAYVVLGAWVVSWPHMFNLVALFATIGGIVLFARYAREAWHILWDKERGRYGSHHAVLGAAEVGLGLIYMGLFRLVYNYFEQPDAWRATWFSSFGLFIVAKGVFRQGTSPDEDLLLAGLPRRFWNIILMAICVMVAFAAGTQFGTIDHTGR
jgi:hypothetical protein